MIPIIAIAFILLVAALVFAFKEKIRERDVRKQIRDFYPFEEDEPYL